MFLNTLMFVPKALEEAVIDVELQNPGLKTL